MTTLTDLDFEDGTLGASVMESGWDTPTLSLTYADDQAHTGTQSAKAASGVYGSLGYDLTGLTEWRVSCYIRCGSEAMENHKFIYWCCTGTWVPTSPADNTYGGDLQLRNVDGGKFACRWDYDSSSIAPTPIPKDAWQRVDLHWSTAAGFTCYVYEVADDTTVEYTLADADAAGQPIVGVWVGKENSAGISMWFDNLRITDGTDPGPAVPPEPPETGNPSLLTLTAQGWG